MRIYSQTWGGEYADMHKLLFVDINKLDYQSMNDVAEGAILRMVYAACELLLIDEKPEVTLDYLSDSLVGALINETHTMYLTTYIEELKDA